jgi:glutamyl-tRNA synthetase
MEDLDTSRVRPEFTEQILQDLEWLGLNWDGEVDMQSDHAAAFQAVASELCERGLAYPCVCTRKEIELARSAPHVGEEEPIYPGSCRDRYGSVEEARRKTHRESALRLRVAGVTSTVRDLYAGEWTEDLELKVGDFPITSRDGQVAYQLAVVLDDARQGVTEVLRGDDLLSSTPRQAYLQDLLGLPRPRWIHVPLVLDEGGQRLAKRHDSLSLRALREAGVCPRKLVAWLGASWGQEVGSGALPEDLVPELSLGALPREPVQFGPDLVPRLKVEN